MSMQENPYQAPSSTLVDDVDSNQMVHVGRGVRFVNFLIDYIVYLALSFVAGVIIGFILMSVDGPEGLERFKGFPHFFIGPSVFTLYYLVFEAAFGRTIGKLVTGTVVVDESGSKPGFKKILGRTLARMIPFEAFSFFASDARGWHDSLSRTYVVKKPKVRA